MSLWAVSQPISDVTLTLFDPITENANHQFRIQKINIVNRLSSALRFASPQVVKIYAYDDRKVEGKD